MLPSASPTPVPSTMPGASMPACAQNTLERERDQEEEHAAQKARIEDRPERVGLGVLQFAGVADRGFEAVGRPGGDIEAAEEQRPAADVPGAIHAGIGGGGRHQVGDVRASRSGPVKIGTRPTSSSGTSTMIASHFCADAVEAMPRCWIGEDDQHQHDADHEGRVEVQRAEAGNVEGSTPPRLRKAGRQRRDRVGRGHGLDGIRRRRAGIGGHIVDDRLRARGVVRRMWPSPSPAPAGCRRPGIGNSAFRM